MTLDDWLDAISAGFLVLGGILSLAAGLGLVRFPDALSRLHAATKPQILGLIFILAAIALEDRNWSTLLVLAPILLFQALTAPISAHMVGRAAYRTGNFRGDILIADELDDAIERASKESGP
jgi:multicomponent Na+:H+ antiporter subunit G